MAFPPTHPELLRSLTERGYAEPTPVQAAVLEPEAAERDLLVSAQTGSGKTVAYGLALAPTLLGDSPRFAPAAEPLALVVAPTRELALQVHRELGWLYQHTGARVASCVGGMDLRGEQRALAQGAHIVVGTPGRLRDHLERGNLDTAGLRAVVLDEADEMLDLGFREDLEFLLDAAPAERRTLLFSATIPKEIAGLARRYQRDALRIAASSANQPHADIEYRALRIAPNDVEHAVVNVLRYFEARGALVFCATREAVRKLHGKLLERGFAAVALSGELSQSERTHALQALRDGRARVCVATDVAARGIDLPDLGLVLHADLPQGRETLLHRSGRTGRAGRKGTAVLLVPHTRRRAAERLLSSAMVDATWGAPPSADAIRAQDRERLMRDAAWAEEPAEEDRAIGRALLAERSAEEIAAALVRLHRARLPEPEELFDSGAERAPSSRPAGSEDTVWFQMNIGRNRDADPRWLIPLICRRGHVTKREIGSIRIFDRETKFEITRDAADRFAAALRRVDDQDGAIRIEPARGDAPAPGRKGPDRRAPGRKGPDRPGPGRKGNRRRDAGKSHA
jgi:ATP-dependent RNA helicase DeaD